MTKLQSQWEFGDLFTQPVARRVLSVSELTSSVKRLLEQQIGRVWVKGEVTNLRLQSSGHLYFSIKDAGAQLNCVLFRGEARSFNRDLLRDGVGVNLQGDLTVYEARGQYQLIVTVVELQGVGALQAAFEKLKQKLQAEGLFAATRKRPLPKYPHQIGIVTSASGAALRDVLQTIRRRHSGLRLVLAACRVQGQGAGEEVACAIRLLNEWSQGAPEESARRIDLILVTRGGGSLEDLWAFNEESVARAIFESRIPVISAVGHEIDFTISDFVADFRAATPSSSAEIITEGFFASRQFVAEASNDLKRLVRESLMLMRQDLTRSIQQLQRKHPRRWVREQWQRLDDLQSSLSRCVRYGYRLHHRGLETLAHRLLRVRPSHLLVQWRTELDLVRKYLHEQTWHRIREKKQCLLNTESQLRLLSPRNVLERGYSITLDAATGQVIRSAGDVQTGQRLRTQLQEGQIESIAQTRTGVS